MTGHEPTPEDFRDAAREMAATGHAFLACELAAEAERLDTHTGTNEEN